MDLEALAWAVDEQAHTPGTERLPARLFGVRLAHGGPVHLEELGRGEARVLPRQVRPPAGLAAIALTATAWAAPMEDDGTMSARPSRHPDRRHVHITVVMSGAGEDVTILRPDGGGPPELLRGGVGVVHQRLQCCWSRRPEAVRRGGR